jgi:hypothetical protein
LIFKLFDLRGSQTKTSDERYVPGKSSLKRFLNWAMPPLGIPVAQLRPDASYVGHILGAVYDIRICEEIFDGWVTQLDK